MSTTHHSDSHRSSPSSSDHISSQPRSSPFSNETLDQRIARVLSQVNNPNQKSLNNNNIRPLAPTHSDSNSSSTTYKTTSSQQHHPTTTTSLFNTSFETPPNATRSKGHPHPTIIPLNEELQQQSSTIDQQERTYQLNDDQDQAQTRRSLDSSGSNSSNEDEDGSISPVTPLTATSPTGESGSSYTPISSATRGIGIDSRQSMNREQAGLGILPSGGNARHLGSFGGNHRGWLPLLFPPASSSSSTSTTGNNLTNPSNGDDSGMMVSRQNENGGQAGLDILMNLIHHSAATSSSTIGLSSSSSFIDSSSTTTTSSSSVHLPIKDIKFLWNSDSDPYLSQLFNERPNPSPLNSDPSSINGFHHHSPSSSLSNYETNETGGAGEISTTEDSKSINQFIDPLSSSTDIRTFFNSSLHTFNHIDNKLDRLLDDLLKVPFNNKINSGSDPSST
ncbi:hypothetical protein MJO28_015375 [Puccinia striiformis f. sp. tritici]|uniref:Uncharacterized protein n=1 Tax=Puccinia striiformis f. sp. tritici TaxID=168172 RepID=A0ACC0DSR6_9BASI|nr:hypothetical protein MJO28_015375 [Puccinia striiformis f. sp. tritici]